MSVALPEALFFTGIDWAAETHAVCVTDAGGKVVAGFAIEHSAAGIALLICRLARHGAAGCMPVAIERPNGRLVGLLLEAGHPVAPVSPNAIKAWRDGEVLSGAKSDAGDAAVKSLDRSVAAHLGEHPDGKIFTSLPRSGQANAAQVLAEWGDCRQAHAGPDSVAALAGCTPVTRESGKHRAVHFRRACSKRFRAAITTYADNSRHASPWAAKIYNDARASGKDHPHAVRILARAWIRVIWRRRLNGVPHDPATHGAAAALAEQSTKQIAA
ncbi:MAG: transposase [Trebonia sp.]